MDIMELIEKQRGTATGGQTASRFKIGLKLESSVIDCNEDAKFAEPLRYRSYRLLIFVGNSLIGVWIHGVTRTRQMATSK
jgi:hypothetical protein